MTLMARYTNSITQTSMSLGGWIGSRRLGPRLRPAYACGGLCVRSVVSAPEWSMMLAAIARTKSVLSTRVIAGESALIAVLPCDGAQP